MRMSSNLLPRGEPEFLRMEGACPPGEAEFNQYTDCADAKNEKQIMWGCCANVCVDRAGKEEA